MRIFLVGYMGVGKSTLGKQLANELHYDFQDLDVYIKTVNNCSITSFFKKYGETTFRKEERHRLLELCLLKNVVIAVGGGTPCFYDNMELMNHYGKTVFIAPPLDFIFERLKDKTMHRPLLVGKTNEELFAFIQKHYHERLPFYEKATYKINSNNIGVEDLIRLFN